MVQVQQNRGQRITRRPEGRSTDGEPKDLQNDDGYPGRSKDAIDLFGGDKEIAS